MVLVGRRRRHLRTGQGPCAEDQLHLRDRASSRQQVRQQAGRRKVERIDRNAGSLDRFTKFS